MSQEIFELHPRLAADTDAIGVLPLCRVLLMNDTSYPWCILVPAQNGLREMHELEREKRQVLMEEIASVSEAMQRAFSAEKMNVAALGNVVPQLHIHVIARFANDPAWPAPVWGAHPAVPYPEFARARMIETLLKAFAPLPGFRSNL